MDSSDESQNKTTSPWAMCHSCAASNRPIKLGR